MLLSIVSASLAVIIALAPFPVGLWLDRQRAPLMRCAVKGRLPMLTAAAVALAVAVHGDVPTVLLSEMVLAASIGGAAMLLVDASSLFYLVQFVDTVTLRGLAERQTALPDAASRLKFVLLITFAAVWEELVFRYLPYVLAGHSFAPYLFAVLLSSVLFALQHVRQGARQVAYSFGLGIFFSGLVWCTDSIWAAVAAHFFGNAFTAFVVRPVLVRSSRGFVAPF